MTFKTLFNVAILSTAALFASCGNSSTEKNTEKELISESDRIEFNEKVSTMEAQLNETIRKIDMKMEKASDEAKEDLKEAKMKAEKMRRELKKDYAEFSANASTKWNKFKMDVDNFFDEVEEEFDDMTDGNS